MPLTSRLAEFVVGRRFVVGIGLLLLTVVAGVGMLRPASPKDYLVREDDQPQFDPPPFILAFTGDDLFSRRQLEAIRSAIAAVRNEPVVERVVWPGDVPTKLAFGSPPILPATDSGPFDASELRQRATQHPLAAEQLISSDGDMWLAIVTYQQMNWVGVDPGDFDAYSTDLLHAAEKGAAASLGLSTDANEDLAATLKKEGLSIEMTGPGPLFFDARRAMDANEIKFQLIGYSLAGLIAAFLFRGIVPIAVVGLAPFMSVLWSVGLLRLFNQPLNALTSPILPVLIAMVGLTDGVHLMTHIRRSRAAGASPAEAAMSAIQTVGAACFLTSLTTAIGFGSLVLADSEFVQSFGIACAVAVSLTFVAVVTVIPLATLLPIAKNIHAGHENDIVGHGLTRFDGMIAFVLRHKRATALLGILITVGLCAVASQMRPDHSVNRSVPNWSPAKATLARVDQAMGGISYARVFVSARGEESVDKDQLVAALADVEQAVVAEEAFSRPMSLLNVLPLIMGDDSALGLKFSLLKLAPAELLSTIWNSESQTAILSMRVQSTGIARYQPLFIQLEEQLKELDAKYPQFEFKLSGDAVVHGRDLYRVVMNLVVSLGAASVIIFLVITLVYRSLRIGLITLTPNIFPLAATGALLVLLQWPLDLSAVCAFTVCLGIAVDDTIHFLSRFQQELSADEKRDINAAIVRTFHKVGVALIMTTVIMVVGFATIITSDLPGQQTFGAMCCCTIAAALLGDMIILPALLAWFAVTPVDRAPEAEEDKTR